MIKRPEPGTRVVSVIIFTVLPLVIFVVVESFLGPLWGAGAAFAWSLGEGILIWAQTRKVEPLIVFDALLLGVMGVVSWLLDIPVLVKLKPAVLEGVCALYTGVLAIQSNETLTVWMSRMMGTSRVASGKAPVTGIGSVKPVFLRKTLIITTLAFVVHALVIVLAALYASKEVWLFVSGALLYIAAGAAFFIALLFRFVKSRRKEAPREEEFPIVDEQGRVIGTAPRSYCHGGSFALHPVVHFHVLAPDGRLLLQKRSLKKDIQPGKWDTAVGGHMQVGETVQAALERECREELGFAPGKAQFIRQYVMKSSIEQELVFSFLGMYRDQEFVLQKEEIDAAEFFTPAGIENMIDVGSVTENFAYEYKTILKPYLDELRLRVQAMRSKG